MIRIKVPASTANLGPGFDTLGLAFNLYHEISIEKGSGNVSEVLWQDSGFQIDDEHNYVLHGIQAAFSYHQTEPVAFTLIMEKCKIPASRGLGSSAAAFVSGVAAGLYLLDLPLDKECIIKIASDLEGHPDNVAPSVLGGMTAACMVDDLVIHQPVTLKRPIQFIALIPDFQMSTAKARAAMPKQYSKEEAVFNLSRLSILLTAFQNGNYELLKYGTQDVLHQPYRLPLMPNANLLSALSAHQKAFGGFVSGAGSTYMLICDPEQSAELCAHAEKTLSVSPIQWHVLPLEVDRQGVVWEVFS